MLHTDMAQRIVAQCKLLHAAQTVTVHALAKMISTRTSMEQATLPAPLYYSIHLKMDKVSALTHFNKLGGCRSRQLIGATISLWEYGLDKRILLSAEFLPGVQNTEADRLSRQFRDDSNWKLNPKVFKRLVARWGKIDLDLFADRLNAQTSIFYSWRPDPLAAGTDAFLMEWTGKLYAFPPFTLIGKCLARVRKEKLDLILIAPAWKAQLCEEPVRLPQDNLLMNPPGQPHPMVLNKSLHLVAWSVSGRLSKREAFRKRLRVSSSRNCVNQHAFLTTQHGMLGSVGAVKGISIPLKRT